MEHKNPAIPEAHPTARIVMHVNQYLLILEKITLAISLFIFIFIMEDVNFKIQKENHNYCSIEQA